MVSRLNPSSPQPTTSNSGSRLGLAPDDVVIGKIARLFELKGHEDLLAVAPELVRRCPRIKFLLVGDGPWRGRFERQVRALGLEKHVVFAGLVPPDGVPPLVGIMDLLCTSVPPGGFAPRSAPGAGRGPARCRLRSRRRPRSLP